MEQSQEISQRFPVATKTFIADLGDGSTTQFSLTAYADKIVIVCTQTATLGTLVHAHKETVLGGGGTTYQTNTLLGPRDNPLPELCARQLIERLSEAGCTQDILLCLGLASGNSNRANSANNTKLLKTIVDTILAHPVWPVQ